MARPVSPLLLLALLLGTAQAELLYFTDFDEFPTGDNEWHNFEGWQASDRSSGAQAIVPDLLKGALGNTATLGFNRPNRSLTTVAKTVNYDPVANGNPLVSFALLFGIEDSTDFTNYRRDNFFVTFYNNLGAPLASIRISNTDTEYGFWYRNGSPQSQGYEEIDTGLDFVQGELQELTGVIDFESNRWSAEIDGLPLFTEAVFNGTNRPLYFGFIAIEWEIAQGSPRDFGDNFLLLSDLRLETVEEPPPPVRISSVRQNANGDIQISWQAAPGYNYAVEYSDNLVSWQGDLSGSSFSAPQQSQTFLFTDASSQGESRFYRIIQTSAE